MSIPNLPVDFKDDILSSTNKKRKYTEINNLDGTKSFEDSTEYDQVGSDFGASQVNKTNQAVNNIYSERILDLDELELVTEPGFFVDALAVAELNSKKPIFLSSSAVNPSIPLTHESMEDDVIYDFMAVVQSSLDNETYKQEITARLNGGTIGINGDNARLMSTFVGQCQKGDTLAISSYKTGGNYSTFFTRVILIPE